MEALETVAPSLVNQRLLNGQGKTKMRVLHPQNGKLKEFMVRAAKLSSGVEMPKVQLKLTEPFLGLLTGIVGTFVVKLIFHRRILQMIGVDVGKGLNLPL